MYYMDDLNNYSTEKEKGRERWVKRKKKKKKKRKKMVFGKKLTARNTIILCIAWLPDINATMNCFRAHDLFYVNSVF